MKKEGYIQVYTGLAKGKCVSIEDSNILTDIGYHKINKLAVDQDKKSFSQIKDCKIIDKDKNQIKPSQYFNNGSDYCWEIETDNGYFCCATKGHKFITINPKTAKISWKELDDIYEDDYVALSKNTQLFGNVKIDNNIAKFIGIMIFSSILKEVDNKEVLTLQTTDKEVVDFLLKHSYETLGIEAKLSVDKSIIYKLYWGDNVKDVLFQRYGLDISIRTINRTIPKLFMSLDRQSTISFLEGLFCKLCMERKKDFIGFSFICNSKEVHYQVKIQLLNLGIITSTKLRSIKNHKDSEERSNMYYLNISGNECINFIKIFNIEKITNFIKINLSSKKEKLEIERIPIKKYFIKKFAEYPYQSKPYYIAYDLKERNSNITYKNLEKYYNLTKDENIKELIDKKYFWDKVKRKEYIGKKFTADIEVPESHSYICNGFVVHNTTAAFGLLLRAVAYDWNILVVQYMKGDPNFSYGEIRSCEKFKENVTIYQSRLDTIDIINMLKGDQVAKENCKRKLKYAWTRTMNLITENNYDLLIMDEILPVLDNELIELENFKDFIENKPELLEVTLTGRMEKTKLTRYIESISDYYTKLELVKHPYNKKCPECGKVFIDDKSSYVGCPYCMKKLVQIPARKAIEY